MKTLTLRNVPDEVVAQLTSIAQETRQSVNRTAVQVMQRSLGLTSSPRRKRDLTSFFGDWSKRQAAEFDKAVAVFEEIDREVWKP